MGSWWKLLTEESSHRTILQHPNSVTMCCIDGLESNWWIESEWNGAAAWHIPRCRAFGPQWLDVPHYQLLQQNAWRCTWVWWSEGQGNKRFRPEMGYVVINRKTWENKDTSMRYHWYHGVSYLCTNQHQPNVKTLLGWLRETIKTADSTLTNNWQTLFSPVQSRHVRFEKGSQTPRLQGKLCGLLGSKGHTWLVLWVSSHKACINSQNRTEIPNGLQYGQSCSVRLCFNTTISNTGLRLALVQ